MRLPSKLLVFVPLLFLWGNCPPHAAAQTVVATIPNNGVPRAVAVNSITNKVYVANCNVHVDVRNIPPSITVIDGATNSATSLPGACPAALAINTVTDKIYFPGGVIDGATNSITDLPGAWPSSLINLTAAAVNPITNKIYVGGPGNVTVIDGTTNSATTVTDPNAVGSPASIAVNTVTNKIYVANYATPGNVTVIDGATNATTTVTDPNAMVAPVSIAVNSVTNKIYVANQGDSPVQPGNITVIDGATNETTTLTDPNVGAPQSVAVNETTNKIYVANANGFGSGDVTVINGATNAISTVTDPNAIMPSAVAVDPASNMIYVANGGCFPPADPCQNLGNVTVINGATNAVATVIDPNGPHPIVLALDSTTNRTYVGNIGSVTVIDGRATAMSHLLLVALAGTGSGTVTSTPEGIECTTSCSASFATGTTVDLAASPASGSTFSGWSTNCTGAGSCNLTLTTSDEVVTANFSTGPPPDFSLTPASTSLTVPAGGSMISDVITIAPLNGSFSSVVQLSCTVTGSTPLATCSLSSNSVTPGANSVISTLTVTAPMQSAVVTPFSASRPLYAVFLPIPFALIGLGLASGKPRNRRGSLLLSCGLFITFVALQVGCGGGSGSKGPSQQQNYTVTVTATSGAIQHTAQVTAIVP